MSSWGLVAPDDEPPVRRVREEVRDGLTACVCSLLLSVGLVVAIALITTLAG